MRYLVIPLLVIFAPLCWSEADVAGKNCTNKYGAKLISLQGKLFFDPDSRGHWQLAQLNETICEGSRVRVEPYSRASLLLSNGVILRLDAGTVLSLNGIAPNKPTLLDLPKGFVHFISRTPRHLEISSPIANAGPEGTEFAMSVDETNASLWVYEGGVRFFNAQGSINLKPGQGAQARLGQAPQAHIDIKPQDAVNWALYYPPLLPYPETSTPIDTDMRTAIRDFRQGRIDNALSRLDALAPEKRTPYFFKVRGAMRLIVGQVTLALQDIHALLANNPNDAEALALQSVLALTQNRKDEAYALANKAISSDPHSATAFSALSYAEQGRFELDKALEAADQAMKYAPHDAMVWARKAELELSKGLTPESEQSARRALGLDATLERTQTVMGFSYLLSMDTDEALQAFEKAVNLDSTSPLARLGLGLAKIRSGDLEEGRQDLEIAAILDPGNSLIRSYLGKAYYEERRSALAEDQFSLAKQRDPKDPTPHFYDAIRKQTTNRPVEALNDMLKAIELNDNRGVYRSKLLLDEDAAARTANLARIYNDLGFNRLALKEAWSSLGYDNTNHSAHRFLADSYVGQARYRAARASELLQAQLMQPINVVPVQPQLTGENIGILNNTGPSSLSTNEYDRLFTSNGVHLLLNGAIGSRNTKTDNAVISGIYNKLSMSLGQFHYQTDGFRTNDDYKQDIYDAFGQYTVTPDLNLQLELKSEDVRAGDTPMRINGSSEEVINVTINRRETVEHDSARFGGHYKIDPMQDFLVSTIFTTFKDINTNKINTVGDLWKFSNNESENKGYQTEFQYQFHPGRFNLIAGAGYLNLRSKTQEQTDLWFINHETGQSLLLNNIISDSPVNKNEYINGYLYSQYNIYQSLKATLGVSFDSFDNVDVNRLQVNPKFGISWQPTNSLTMRAAAFKTLKRPLATQQTLEPTQVAGFNQLYDSENGTIAWNYGFGIDYQIRNTMFFGGQLIYRQTTFPNTLNNSQDSTTTVKNLSLSRNEASYLTYYYWTPTNWFSLSAEYHFDEFHREFQSGVGDNTDPRSIATHWVPLTLNIYHPSGFFNRITANHIDQHVTFVQDNSGLEGNSTSFWTFDAAIGYRLPKKFGSVSLEVRNLFDTAFNYQSTFDASGPQLTPFIPERQLFFKLNLAY